MPITCPEPQLLVRAEAEEPSLEPGCLYAVLTSRDELGVWDWSFYVPNDKPAGGRPVGKSPLSCFESCGAT